MVLSTVILIFSLCCSLTVAVDWKSFVENPVDLSITVPRIIGGDVAAPHAYPYQVGLLINGQAFCGGSLISPNYVLTAAHCGVVISSVEVILGAQNVTADEDTQVIIYGKEVIVHEDYNFTSFQNDIALIKLQEPAPINDAIQIISLPSREDANNDYEGDTVISTGWGLSGDVGDTNSNANLNDLSQLLRFVNVSVLNNSECGEFYNEDDVSYVTEKNICTSGYKDKGTCNGDSGGPLVYNNVQIGLVSIGTDLCELCSPSIFTKVAVFVDWIAENSDVVIS